ncbi:MAG: FtsH protease activity modulator HflK [Woeseiaceae bacterium]
MAWNEDGNGKDPWRRGGDQPNDLDQIVQEWQKKFSRILGGRGDGGGSATGGIVLAVVLVGAWLLTGFYRVDEAERGVVQRFGAYTETTLPGLRWHLPYPIETVDMVNTTAISNYAYRTEMLTADEQYVFIDMVVQYRRSDPVKYSFEVVDPESTLQDVTESALREVVGTTSLEEIVTARRDEIASRTQEALQTTMDMYGEGTGITVTSISLETVNYPQAVQAAVDDAQKARNDSERYILQADEYANDVIPKARGEAARVLEDALAYRDRKIADAEGEAARFESVLAEYQKAPRVTRDRLYLEAIEEVYGRSAKVLMDTDGSGNLLYLPLDQIMNRSSGIRSGTCVKGGHANEQRKVPGPHPNWPRNRRHRPERLHGERA